MHLNKKFNDYVGILGNIYILKIQHQSAQPARLLWYVEVLYTPKPLGIRAVLWCSLPQTRQTPQIFLIKKKKSYKGESCPIGNVDDNLVLFPICVNAG
jgi:hypothetical protein